MAALETNGNCPKFASMPNFRKLPSSANVSASDHVGSSENGCSAFTVQLYRSSRPDFLTETEINEFRKLGIVSIIDFRSAREYRKANGTKLLDSIYHVFKVKIPTKFEYGDRVQCVPVKRYGIPRPANEHSVEKHYLIDFFRINYVWAVFRRAPWYMALYSLLYLIADLVLFTGYKHFVRFFAKHVLNKEGLLGQYIDMITYSQASICAALKLLSEPQNVPAMLNCAHGKDRTGIVCALILSCVGLNKEDIAKDYAQSERGLELIISRVYDEIVTHFHMCTTFTTAREETMMKVLQHIEERYGSTSKYLEMIGFSCEEQKKLKNNLLRPTPVRIH